MTKHEWCSRNLAWNDWAMMAHETLKVILELPCLRNELVLFGTLNWQFTVEVLVFKSVTKLQSLKVELDSLQWNAGFVVPILKVLKEI
jgi:hypothetical protein